jgi:hypothetical protein
LSLGRRNIRDQQLGKSLSVASGATIILAALLLEDGNGSGPPLPYDFRCDFGAVKKGLSDQNAGIAMDETDMVEFNMGPDVPRQPFDLNRRARFNPILFTTCFNDRVHNLISEA